MYYKILGVIAIPMGYALQFLYDFIQNYGVTIVVFTIIVRCCLYPLYMMQIKSTAAMSGLQPKIQAIQKQYAGDKETQNQKMMELYKEENVNPMGGCLPMLIQMPIILGLFVLLRNPLYYIHADGMLMAIHESFLWIKDLSQPDPWILPLAAGVTTYISFTLTQKVTNQAANNAAADAMAPMMKIMKYFFPVMIVAMGHSFPAGLTVYWFFGQVIQVFFTMRMNKVRQAIMDGTYEDKKSRKKAKAA